MPLPDIFILEKFNSIFLTHLIKDQIENYILTRLTDCCRPGDIFKGSVQRLEGKRAWIDIGQGKAALIKNNTSKMNVGEIIFVRIDRVPMVSPLSLKGAQVTRIYIEERDTLLKKGKIQSAPHEWLHFLKIQTQVLKIITNSETIFFSIKKEKMAHEVIIKSDLKIPREIEGSWKALLDAKVEIPGGGWLYFEEGETLTAIDVNTASGEFKGPDLKDERDLFLLSRRAAEVIKKQLSDRQIGGMIVIDFPRLLQKKYRDSLFHSMQMPSAQILGFTKGGLFEIIRPQSQPSLPQRLKELIAKEPYDLSFSLTPREEMPHL